MMMAEKIQNVFQKIIGFGTGIIATIVAGYLFGITALFIIIAGGCITFAIRRRHKRLTNEIEALNKQVETLKNEIEEMHRK